ncbi:tRNA (guanine-N1)-methyltransferase [Alkalinema sp. FACHB-956]|uniref:tRNA (guanine-N1)-methyltransferase n=1 Tax=Alkalinema sp. FACHB-956 TaxID=2692768 RepID=UPI001681F113|nr:tRNA (guanine-N1)-methyltransferase [Alkalinema sp. FACHB-956]MBD2329757.1 tRNA (guanine-N1)-methyltransferase [Alkalinema sp. FACHB-956]
MQQEGKATFQIGHSFYRPSSQLSRDLGVLAAAIYKQQTGELRVLDAMTGCGVRILRYALESGADYLWANDGNPEVHYTLRQNLAPVLEPDRYQITHEPANRIFWQCALDRDYYDLIDIDAFGSPGDLIAPSLPALKYGGLLYLTSTDGRIVSGHFPQDSLRLYGAYARSHPSVQEQALRILLGAIAQHSAAQHSAIQPVFALYSGQTYRVMARVLPKASNLAKFYGFLGYCSHCGHYESLDWRYLSRAHCANHHPPQPMSLSGPLWLGALHDRAFLRSMADLAQTWQWSKVVTLLQTMQAEADLPPYYFPLGEIGRRGQFDIPPRDRLIHALINAGYAASSTHLDPQAIKTTASLKTCVEVAQSLSISRAT